MPGRKWYVVAVVILVGALGGAAWIVISGIGGMGAGLFQFVVPGSADLELEEAGTYTILQAPVQTGTPPDISGLRVTVRAANGTEVALRSISGTATETLGTGTDRSMLVFDVETPGIHRFTATYDDGRRQPRAALIVSGGLVGGMMRIVIALGIALIGLAAAIAIVIVVAVRRRRALRGVG